MHTTHPPIARSVLEASAYPCLAVTELHKRTRYIRYEIARNSLFMFGNVHHREDQHLLHQTMPKPLLDTGVWGWRSCPAKDSNILQART